MRTLDVIACVILIIGGLNWGLIGFFDFNLISMIFGEMTALTRLIYCLIGLSGLYTIFQWKSMQKRGKRK